MPQAFISYASADGDFAELVRDKLETAGVPVWVDQGQLRTGDEWRNAIDHGIASSDAVIVVVSRASSESPYVTYEWAFALGRGKKILPVLLEPAEMHPRLEVLQYLDFSNRQSRPWDLLVHAVKGSSGPGKAAAARVEVNTDYETAKTQILEYLDEKGIRMVSFEAIRRYIDPAYDDDFLMEVIRHNHDELRRRVLEGDRPGVGRK